MDNIENVFQGAGGNHHGAAWDHLNQAFLRQLLQGFADGGAADPQELREFAYTAPGTRGTARKELWGSSGRSPTGDVQTNVRAGSTDREALARRQPRHFATVIPEAWRMKIAQTIEPHA